MVRDLLRYTKKLFRIFSKASSNAEEVEDTSLFPAYFLKNSSKTHHPLAPLSAGEGG